MKKKWIIFDAATGDSFSCADLEGVYFDKLNIRCFDSEESAMQRMYDEYELFPNQFNDRVIIILPVFITTP